MREDRKGSEMALAGRFDDKSAIESMQMAIEESRELAARFNGPHHLTDKHGWSAKCCGTVDGCYWCASEALYMRGLRKGS